MPDDIPHLTLLKEARLYNNQIAAVFAPSAPFAPRSLGGSVRILRMVNNHVTTPLLNVIAAGCPLLEELALSHNRISLLHGPVCSLANLQRLLLHSNRITDIFPDVTGLISLQTLVLTENRLIRLPPELSGCSKLRVRHGPFVQSKSVTFCSGAVPGRQPVGISSGDGRETRAAGAFKCRHGVKNCNILSRFWSSCRRICTRLSMLHPTLRNCNTCVQKVVQSSNPLPPELVVGEGAGPNSGWFMRTCEEARASGYVALQHRALRRVPEVIALCDAATDVDLSDNAISSLPSLLHWHSLVTCTLANNVLVELPYELPLPPGKGVFQHLLQLNLSGNMLNSSVRHATWLWQLTALTYLDMSLNPLACDINLEGLVSLRHCCIRQALVTNCPACLPATLTHLDLSRNSLRELPGDANNGGGGLRAIECLQLRFKTWKYLLHSAS
jgi:Leucine-rich repeat (LRR) protein